MVGVLKKTIQTARRDMPLVNIIIRWMVCTSLTSFRKIMVCELTIVK